MKQTYRLTLRGQNQAGSFTEEVDLRIGGIVDLTNVVTSLKRHGEFPAEFLDRAHFHLPTTGARRILQAGLLYRRTYSYAELEATVWHLGTNKSRLWSTNRATRACQTLPDNQL